MNSNQGTYYSCWERWGNMALIVYCASTIFMVFFSTTAIQIWPYPWNRLSILIASLLPMILVIVWKIPAWIHQKEFQKELYFALIIVILGILNIVFSDNRPVTLKMMVLFLISGIGIFAVTSSLFSTKFRRAIFLWLCWISLLALCVSGTIEYLDRKSIFLFSYNPIPAGSLLILFFVGPLVLFASSSWRLSLIHVLSIVFGIVLIVLIGKRGPIFGLLGMAFLLGSLLIGRRFWIIVLILLIFVGIEYKFRNNLSSTFVDKLIIDRPIFTIINRLEGYPFAVHVFSKNPLFGVGLGAPLEKYLRGYREKITIPRRYPFFQHIKDNRTLENIILCGFVEMGGLFTIAYIVLLIYLLARVFGFVRRRRKSRLHAILLLTPLFGFFIHSMTFDSLIYPHLNWLFHSLLGLMANFDKI
jgi:hypothetical protein